jgi:hypothetical protein
MESGEGNYRLLAAYRHCVERITTEWPHFLAARADRLRHGDESEKVAEAILEDLFTGVLDWSKGDLAYQIDFADIVLSRNLAKYLVIEVKRPGSLRPVRHAFDGALDQARRYADSQRVPLVAASDGRFLYAADVAHGGPKDRVLADLSAREPPHALWWLSMHGIYRPCGETVCWPSLAPTEPCASADVGERHLLHPKYALPPSCFAHVGDANDPRTWKLPYRLADGRVDEKRLPKAIQALLSNYRGTKVGGIPERHLPDVLVRLAQAAETAGRMPRNAGDSAPVYRQLALVLEQLGLKA